MSIDQSNVIDFLVHDTERHHAVLIISDHLPWARGEGEHLKLLQDKLNHYIWFFESGKMVETMPELAELPLSIVVWAKYPLSDGAKRYYELAKRRALDLGFALEFDLKGKSFTDSSESGE
ncbi:MAG TPA: DUF6572 domain-containing protein [Reyranella sp.]|jgi:hypothetical protein